MIDVPGDVVSVIDRGIVETGKISECICMYVLRTDLW